ncbi:MAG: hypothetical protein ACKVHE_29215 [Planctomycetales bacterium]
MPDIAVKEFQPLISGKVSSTVYLAALEATAGQDIRTAAVAGHQLLNEIENAESFGPVLSIIMNRRRGAQAMATALNDGDLSIDNAKQISRWISASGHDDAELVNGLKARIGIKQGQPIVYDAALVQSLIEEVRQSGDAAAGKQVFLSSLTNCTACHQVQNVTPLTNAYSKGPDLTAVAAGLPLQLIVEAVIWPKRQIKEGYKMSSILTDDGRAFSGYLTSETDNTVGLRDLATGKVREIPAEAIEERTDKGTAMPSGFTNSLTRKELRDLITWLASLKGNNKQQ